MWCWAGLMVGLDDHGGLFQPQQVCDSGISISKQQHCPNISGSAGTWQCQQNWWHRRHTLGTRRGSALSLAQGMFRCGDAESQRACMGQMLPQLMCSGAQFGLSCRMQRADLFQWLCCLPWTPLTRDRSQGTCCWPPGAKLGTYWLLSHSEG